MLDPVPFDGNEFSTPVVAVRDPEKAKNLSAYVRVQLFHCEKDKEWKTKVVERKCVSPETGADIMWNERFDWQYNADELAFIRWDFYFLYSLSLSFSRVSR